MKKVKLTNLEKLVEKELERFPEAKEDVVRDIILRSYKLGQADYAAALFAYQHKAFQDSLRAKESKSPSSPT